MTLNIRRFAPQDQPGVERLVLEIQQLEFGLELTAENQPDLRDVDGYFSAPKSAFWVAEAPDGAIVGCIGLEAMAQDVAVMRKFMMHQAWRGAAVGVSTALLAAFEAHARAQGFALIALSTVAATKAAQRFYEKAGYQRVARSALPPAYSPGVLDSVFFLKALMR